VEFQPWWFDLSGIGLLVIGLWIFRKATPQIEEQVCEVPPVIETTEQQRLG
jgi:hypothetical protein